MARSVKYANEEERNQAKKESTAVYTKKKRAADISEGKIKIGENGKALRKTSDDFLEIKEKNRRKAIDYYMSAEGSITELKNFEIEALKIRSHEIYEELCNIERVLVIQDRLREDKVENDLCSRDQDQDHESEQKKRSHASDDESDVE